MTDYIKRDKRQRTFIEIADDLNDLATELNDKIVESIREENADAVPVVRCKDCKWWTKQEKSIQGRCALAGIYPTGGWYCGNGERRDDEDR